MINIDFHVDPTSTLEAKVLLDKIRTSDRIPSKACHVRILLVTRRARSLDVERNLRIYVRREKFRSSVSQKPPFIRFDEYRDWVGLKNELKRTTFGIMEQLLA